MAQACCCGGSGQVIDYSEEIPLKDPESQTLNPEDDEMEAHGIVFEEKVAVWQVTIRKPLDYNPLNLIALSYGFLPFVVPALFILEVIYSLAINHRIHLFSTWGLLIIIFCFILNEFILKPILKQPRPAKTANKYPDGRIKPGMPSGHVYNASALMVWLLCEVVHDGPGFDNDHISVTVRYLLYVILLMGPVPWARVYNYDHTIAQCTVSFVLGLITGIAAHLIRYALVHGWCEPWSEDPDFPQCFSNITYGVLEVLNGTNGTNFTDDVDASGNITLLGSGGEDGGNALLNLFG